MKGDRLWPVGIVAVLGITVAANVALFWVAGRGDGSAVERDYYRRAVAWDSTLAEQARSRALGWHVTVSLTSPADGRSTLDCAVVDAQGAPVAGASVHVEGSAIAHSTLRLDAELYEVTGGHYAVRLPVSRAEWHELRFTVARANDRFGARVRCLPGQECRVS